MQALLGQIIQICHDINCDTRYEAYVQLTKNNVLRGRVLDNEKNLKDFYIILDENCKKEEVQTEINKLEALYREGINIEEQNQ